MPNGLFILFAVLAGSLAFLAYRRESSQPLINDEHEEDNKDEDKADFDISAVKDNSKISLNIGYGLVTLVSSEDEDSLVPSVTKIRKEVSKRLGFVVPV